MLSLRRVFLTLLDHCCSLKTSSTILCCDFWFLFLKIHNNNTHLAIVWFKRDFFGSIDFAQTPLLYQKHLWHRSKVVVLHFLPCKAMKSHLTTEQCGIKRCNLQTFFDNIFLGSPSWICYPSYFFLVGQDANFCSTVNFSFFTRN